MPRRTLAFAYQMVTAGIDCELANFRLSIELRSAGSGTKYQGHLYRSVSVLLSPADRACSQARCIGDSFATIELRRQIHSVNWFRGTTMQNENDNRRILLVEDDADLASMVSDFLALNGFDVAVEGRGDDAVARILGENPEAVILDINLPGLDGLSVCQSVRPDYHGTILILTARGDEVDEVVSLEVGADDYMAKPVRPRALLARLQVHLRRSSDQASGAPVGPIESGSLRIEPSRRAAELAGKALQLTTAEFDLLLLLAENVGQSLSRNEIYQRIHGMNYDGLDRSIDLRVSRLRKKLGDDPANPQRIKSVRGVGYMLVVES